MLCGQRSGGFRLPSRRGKGTAMLRPVLLQDALCAQPPGWTVHPQNSHEPSAQAKGQALGPAISRMCPQALRCGAHLILAAAAGPAHHLRSAERAEAGRGEHAPGQPQDAAALGSARHGLRPHCPSPKPHRCPVSEWTLGPAGLCHLPSRCSLCLWPGPDRAAGSRLRLLRLKLPDETQRPPPWSVRRVRPSPHSALP